MQDGKEPAFRASLDRRRPCIGARRPEIVGEVEDVDYTFPYGFALEHLADGHGLDERGRPAVLGFYGLFQFAYRILAHETPV